MKAHSDAVTNSFLYDTDRQLILADTYIFLRRSLDHTGQTLDTHPTTHSYFFFDSLFRYISLNSYLHRLSCMTPSSSYDSLRLT